MIVKTWAPLTRPLFRGIWIASVVSNFGTLMHNTGAAWLMTSINPSPILVALVQAVTVGPVFLLALPAGALADITDRRRMILLSQFWMLLMAGALAVLTHFHLVTPGLLIALTFGLGIGSVMSIPAWDAMVSEMVPAGDLPQAVALNGAAYNIAKAIGPALAGLLIAAKGPQIVFFINAGSFIGTIWVVGKWKPELTGASMLPENVFGAMVAGLRYVRHSPLLHHLFLRAFLFILPASALWGLLPLVVRFEFKSGPMLYGVFLAFLGFGAILGSLALPFLRNKLSIDSIIAINSAIFASGLGSLVLFRSIHSLAIPLILTGMVWLIGVSLLSAGVLVSIPSWVRARAISMNSLVVHGSMGAGSLIWGALASLLGVMETIGIAATFLFVLVPFYFRYKLIWKEHTDFTPAGRPLFPAQSIHPSSGPVLITVEYHVDPDQAPAFIQAAHELRRIRRRNGATHWGIFQDTTNPSRYMETFLVDSWAEHLRLHHRVTVADLKIEEWVEGFHIGDAEPVVNHFISGLRRSRKLRRA